MRSWDKAPTKRLGELIAECLDMQNVFDIRTLREISDANLVEAIERHLAGLGRQA
jgi:hypothetical protein